MQFRVWSCSCACLLSPKARNPKLFPPSPIGEDFDQRVMEYFIKLIKKKFKKDITGDARALQKLRREAERAKRALSSQHQVQGGTTITNVD